MALELHPNDNAREAKPSLWIFTGRSVGWLVIGVMFFITLYVVLSRQGVEWMPAGIISALPLMVITLLVQFCVNGRPPSFALDLLALAMWRLRCWWYIQGGSARPPQWWVVASNPRHPREFNPKAEA